jgi:hypothetical protein
VVLIDGQVVTGPFATAAELVKAGEAFELPIPKGARHATGDVIELLTGVERVQRLPDTHPSRITLKR